MSARLIAHLRAQARRMARAAVARLQGRVAQRWAGRGELVRRGDVLRLSGPGLRQRRRGTRLRLADPSLLWPGDE